MKFTPCLSLFFLFSSLPSFAARDFTASSDAVAETCVVAGASALNEMFKSFPPTAVGAYGVRANQAGERCTVTVTADAGRPSFPAERAIRALPLVGNGYAENPATACARAEKEMGKELLRYFSGGPIDWTDERIATSSPLARDVFQNDEHDNWLCHVEREFIVVGTARSVYVDGKGAGATTDAACAAAKAASQPASERECAAVGLRFGSVSQRFQKAVQDLATGAWTCRWEGEASCIE